MLLEDLAHKEKLGKQKLSCQEHRCSENPRIRGDQNDEHKHDIDSKETSR